MKRDTYLDGLKFFLIFSVIMVHALTYEGMGIYVTKIIHSYIMPVFVLLSGYFTKISSDEKFLKWLRKTFCIFLIFQVGLVLLEWVLGEEVGWRVLIVPQYALWYLVSLIFWRLSIQLLAKIHVLPNVWMLVVSVCLVPLISFIPIGLEFSFQRTFVFFPFYVAGLLVNQHQLLPKVNRVNKWLSVAVSVLALVVACVLTSFIPKVPCGDMKDLAVRMLQIVNSFVICFCIFRLMPREPIKKMAGLGKDSMYFYLYHVFFILIQRHVFAHFHIHANVLVAFLLAIFYVLVIMLMKKFRIFRMPMMEK